MSKKKAAKYVMQSGVELDLGALSDEEKSDLSWLISEAKRAESWEAFQNRTVDRIRESAKKRREKSWQKDTLYLLYLDLISGLSVHHQKCGGCINPSFYDLLGVQRPASF